MILSINPDDQPILPLSTYLRIVQVLHRPSVTSSMGRIVQATHSPRGASSRGRIVHRTLRPGDASSKGRIVQGTHRLGDASSKGSTAANSLPAAAIFRRFPVWKLFSLEQSSGPTSCNNSQGSTERGLFLTGAFVSFYPYF
jgi:hypothetical protein